jgi:Transposase DDE domain group 1
LDETGEPLAAILRPGNAGSNTADDHFSVLALALEQLPAADLEREILVRTDSGGATHAFTADCRDVGIRFSVGYEPNDSVRQAILDLPESAWVPAIDADATKRDGAWVAELTDRLDLFGWPHAVKQAATPAADGHPRPRRSRLTHDTTCLKSSSLALHLRTARTHLRT